MKNIAVAIDGPAGSGKSSAAKRIALKYGFAYIDTGAMYRCVGYYCDKNGVDMLDEKAVSAILDDITLDIEPTAQGQKILLNGEDVTLKIRNERAGAAASKVAAIGEVRRKLVGAQRKLAEGRSIVMDGRDIGTNVLPNAEVKIYLTASAKVRAQRRLKEIKELGKDGDLSKIEEEIKERDYQDTTRELNPLKKADDAKEINTDNMNADEVVEAISEIINKRAREE